MFQENEEKDTGANADKSNKDNSVEEDKKTAVDEENAPSASDADKSSAKPVDEDECVECLILPPRLFHINKCSQLPLLSLSLSQYSDKNLGSANKTSSASEGTSYLLLSLTRSFSCKCRKVIELL